MATPTAKSPTSTDALVSKKGPFMSLTKQSEKSELPLTNEYKGLLKEIKQKVLSSQLKAAVAVNEELIRLYWEIGRLVVERQQKEAWGTNVLERLARDLQNSFPGMKGFSRSNLFRMRGFYLSCEKVAQLVRQFDELPFFRIPWGHNILLVQRVNSEEARLWYAQQTIIGSLSRKALEDWIHSDAFSRQGSAVTNFKTQLPYPQSSLAQETLKDPYNFDFLTLRDGYHEKELEQGLIDHIQQFLLELGAGFAFIGRQYPIEVDDEDYYVDLLFYHLKLHCYCVIELKTTEFRPEHAGKMNFYLSAIDDLIKQPSDNPSIGMILCKTKKKVTVDYAFRDINKPIGVSEYEVKILESLPDNLKGSLPTIEQIENEFEDEMQDD